PWLVEAIRVAPRVLDELAHAVGVETDGQPCLRDVRPEHLLFTDDRLTGLVDFGAAGVDTVAADLGRLASEWLGPDRVLRSAGLGAYHAVRPIGPEEMALIEVFERSAALLGGSHWVRWHFVERRRFEDPGAVGRGLEKSLERLRLLSRVSG
ncbi:MAG: phosphotransferase, partial [Planctomycetia bacterium]|nr:phosphotransferase [Planctomycetia bacterium]